MTGTISILHISDLHRSKGSEISNTALLASLVNDSDKYTTHESPKIKLPDLIIVSGDVIHGSIKSDGSELEVQVQYDEAIEFLNQLTNHFLNGDKKKIIVIPGNHDVDWKFSKDSMTKVDGDKVFDTGGKVKAEVLKEAINQNSKMRWNWRDLSFYDITHYEKYSKRLEAFSNFYSTFYAGTRQFSLDPAKQYDIFDLPNFNLTIVAFNSCLYRRCQFEIARVFQKRKIDFSYMAS
jgi:predicted MPP superfamily phosphohydrolase